MKETLNKITRDGWNVELQYRQGSWTCFLIPTTHLNYSYSPAGMSADPETAVNLALKDATTRKIRP